MICLIVLSKIFLQGEKGAPGNIGPSGPPVSLFVEINIT